MNYGMNLPFFFLFSFILFGVFVCLLGFLGFFFVFLGGFFLI